jgi:hypothetical protein
VKRWSGAYPAGRGGGASAANVRKGLDPPAAPFDPGAANIDAAESAERLYRQTTDEREEFIGCSTERPGMKKRQTWYNLRFVEQLPRARR